MGKALRIFELAQFVGQADQHIGIGADTEAAAMLPEQGRGKRAVTEIGLGDRAKAGNGAALGHADRFGIGHMGGVDQAPALVDIGIGQQEFDRTRAGPGETVLDLLNLFGDVDVDRPIRRQSGNMGQFLRRRGAQAVRRDTDDSLIQRANRFSRLLNKPGEPIHIVDESPLAFVWSRSTEGGVCVKHRQQRQADAGFAGGGRDALGHLGQIGVGFSVAVVVQIVEFADAGKTSLQHLDIELRGNRLDLVWRHR